jgi:hypothetical protein
MFVFQCFIKMFWNCDFSPTTDVHLIYFCIPIVGTVCYKIRLNILTRTDDTLYVPVTWRSTERHKLRNWFRRRILQYLLRNKSINTWAFTSCSKPTISESRHFIYRCKIQVSVVYVNDIIYNVLWISNSQWRKMWRWWYRCFTCSFLLYLYSWHASKEL